MYFEIKNLSNFNLEIEKIINEFQGDKSEYKS